MKFIKMHGTGNDFILVNREDFSDNPSSDLCEYLCDRNFGIGSNGILVIDKGHQEKYKMTMYNPDGSTAMCGNGMRCFAKYLYDESMVDSTEFIVETDYGDKGIQIVSSPQGELIQVDMGFPIFEPSKIPVNGSLNGSPVVKVQATIQSGESFDLYCVSMGNPHAILFVDDVWHFPLEKIGPLIEHHPLFPQRTNFEIVQIVNKSEVQMRVWERGAGLTLSCGTGVTAVSVASVLVKGCNSPLTVKVPGGKLSVRYQQGEEAYLIGPATYVYSGEIDISQVILKE